MIYSQSRLNVLCARTLSEWTDKESKATWSIINNILRAMSIVCDCSGASHFHWRQQRAWKNDAHRKHGKNSNHAFFCARSHFDAWISFVFHCSFCVCVCERISMSVCFIIVVFSFVVHCCWNFAFSSEVLSWWLWPFFSWLLFKPVFLSFHDEKWCCRCNVNRCTIFTFGFVVLDAKKKSALSFFQIKFTLSGFSFDLIRFFCHSYQQKR